MAQHSSDAGAMSMAGVRVRRRVLQLFSAMRHRADPETDLRLKAVVHNDRQWQLLERLSPFDRSHHLRVHSDLVRSGHDDCDLLLAAALHDVGKADRRGRVRLGHRVLFVLMVRVAPGALRRVSRDGGNVLTHGLYLACHHASLGAALVAETGASARCCALIAAHQSDPALVDDPDLLELIHADDGTLA